MSRKTQPYKRGKVRPKGATFAAMLLGRSPTMGNPADTKRAIQKQAKRGKRRRRMTR